MFKRNVVRASDFVGELCDSIDAATRGDVNQAGSEIRRALMRGLELFMAHTIDRRGMSSITRASYKAKRTLRTRFAQGGRSLAGGPD